ncbi:ROK family protein [Corynebacterium sp.]|uniref:ROK family transcriptional regulator n=1 Tax=Corynebacterium sp. TaxID=1720 RepID=UPI0025C1094F|nr:ROK family protein [Corynebacterium sp.]
MAGVRESDRAFLEAVLDQGSASRAEVAGTAGISKPTASEAAVRLVDAGVLRESGTDHGRRGRSPLLYEVDPGFGVGLAVAAQTRGLDIGVVGMDGGFLRRRHLPLDPRLSAEEFAVLLVEHVQEDLAGTAGAYGAAVPCRAAAVSLAAPVDPGTGRVVRLGEAPFPAADTDVHALLSPLVAGPVVVDNDVNWAALATCAQRRGLARETVLHLHLGTGLGAALTVEGWIVRGRRGAFGELGRIRSDGRTVTDRLGELGVLEEGGYAISVPACLELVDRGPSSAQAERLIRVLAETVGVAVMLLDPDRLVVTGPIATDAVVGWLTDRLHRSLDDGAVPEVVRVTGQGASPLDGARSAAHDQLIAQALASCG